MKFKKPLLIVSIACVLLGAAPATAATVVTGFSSSTLAANDDGSTAFVSFGFLNPLNFYGVSYTGAYLNNNGNMTFTGPLATFTPFGITAGSLPMIAPFFADVDTYGAGSALMTYGSGTFGGRAAFGQTWDGAGYYGSHYDRLNKFQTLLVDRSDIAVGDFDIYFNYDQIQWETGDASGGSGGMGGVPAHAGYTNGAGSYFEFAGSGVSGAFLDGGPAATSLINNSNIGVDGRYLFQVRSGVVTPPPSVPDAASTLGLFGLAFTALLLLKRRFV